MTAPAPPRPIREEVARRAARIERYAEQRRAEAGNWAPGSTLHADVLAHAEAIAGDAAALRELAAANAALVKERDALREEWVEIAAGLTDEQPEVGALWPLVSEVSGALSASRNLFRNEIAAHNRTKTERDAALARVARLEDALASLVRLADALASLAQTLLVDGPNAENIINADVLAAARAALATEPPK